MLKPFNLNNRSIAATGAVKTAPVVAAHEDLSSASNPHCSHPQTNLTRLAKTLLILLISPHEPNAPPVRSELPLDCLNFGVLT